MMFCNTLGDFTFSCRMNIPVACEGLPHTSTKPLGECGKILKQFLPERNEICQSTYPK